MPLLKIRKMKNENNQKSREIKKSFLNRNIMSSGIYILIKMM